MTAIQGQHETKIKAAVEAAALQRLNLVNLAIIAQVHQGGPFLEGLLSPPRLSLDLVGPLAPRTPLLVKLWKKKTLAL